MGDLSEERAATVRKLLREAPDTAVQSLEGLLLRDLNSDGAIAAVRELIRTESLDRRLRNTVFASILPLFGPPSTVPRISFPPPTCPGLWHAIRCAHPELIAQAMDAHGPAYPVSNANAVYDELCRYAARALSDGDHPLFQSLAEALDAEPGRSGRLIKVLELAPLLRQSLRKLPAWLTNTQSEHTAAMRVAFRQAANVAEDTGFLFLEVLFAHLEEPSHILRLISVLMDHPTERYVAASEMASFGERLLDSIDRNIDAVRLFDTRRGLEGGVATASAAGAASLRLAEFEHQITLAKSGVWGVRVSAQRHGLANAMEMRLRDMEPAVSAALPAQTMRSGLRRSRGPAIVSAPPDQVAVDRALALLALLDGCRTSAPNGGFGAMRAQVVESLDAMLDAYTHELLDLLQRTGADRAQVRNISVHLDTAAEMIGLARGSEAAEIVRRRAAAAWAGLTAHKASDALPRSTVWL